MSLITLDFETAYRSKKNIGTPGEKYSLKGMTYEEYIFDPRFAVHGVGIKVDNNETQWHSGDIRPVLEEYFSPGNDNILLAHNTAFDGAILSWHYGLSAKAYWDTQGMSNALWNQQSAALDALTKRLFPDDPSKWKGKELASFDGLWPEDLNLEQQDILGGYCIQDVDITFDAFRKMWEFFPRKELDVLDMTLKMFIHPGFVLDTEAVEDYYQKLEDEKQQLLEAGGISQSVLASNPKFTAYLEENHGIIIPEVLSPTLKNPNNTKLALAKDDLEFIEIRKNHPELDHLWDARIAIKSTGEINRCQRLLAHVQPKTGRIAVPQKYYGSHTGRWSGYNRVNFLNFKRNSPIRRALYAPPGYKVVVRDLSNIEGRVNAAFNQQEDKCAKFAAGVDLYNEIASELYGYPVERKAKSQDAEGNYLNADGEIVSDPDDAALLYWEEGFVGKTCFSADTPVLTDQGWTPIAEIQPTDKIWDGQEWVNHSGVIHQGEQETLRLCGVNVTKTHKILCGTQWREAQYLVQDGNTLSQALGTGAENLPLQAMLLGPEEASLPSWLHAPATPGNTLWMSRILKPSNRAAVINAQKPPQADPDTSNTPMLWKTMRTALDCLTGYLRQSAAAITLKMHVSITTGGGESTSTKNGEMTGPRSLNTSRRAPAGMTPLWRWIEKITTWDMSRETYGSPHGKKTTLTAGKSPYSKNASKNLNGKMSVYDVANAGPRNRFTILTEHGPLIAHNCELGLGYGMGAAKFRDQCAKLGDVLFEEAFCKKVVDIWRTKNYKINAGWKFGDRAIFDMARRDCEPYQWNWIRVERGRLVLPNGLALNYPGLRLKEDEQGRRQFEYWNGKFYKSLYGGLLMENIIQALARIVMSDMMLEIQKYLEPIGGWIALTVHDEIIVICPEQHAEETYEVMGEIMATPPAWANDGLLALASEGGIADNYSK